MFCCCTLCTSLSGILRLLATDYRLPLKSHLRGSSGIVGVGGVYNTVCTLCALELADVMSKMSSRSLLWSGSGVYKGPSFRGLRFGWSRVKTGQIGDVLQNANRRKELNAGLLGDASCFDICVVFRNNR